jgi:hypothetical protein
VVASVALIQACQPAGDKSDSKGEPATDATDSTPGPDTGIDPLSLQITGNLKFLVDDGADVVLDAPVAGATVFLAGFPDAAVLTGADGVFSIALELEGSGLTGTPADYDLVAWKTVLTTKYGIMKKAEGVVPNAPFDMGELKLGYTNVVKFDLKEDNEAHATIDASSVDCVMDTRMVGFGDKSVFSPDGTFLKVDYLPQGAYKAHLACAGYEAKDYEFSLTAFDETQPPPAWQHEFVDLTPVTP